MTRTVIWLVSHVRIYIWGYQSRIKHKHVLNANGEAASHPTLRAYSLWTSICKLFFHFFKIWNCNIHNLDRTVSRMECHNTNINVRSGQRRHCQTDHTRQWIFTHVKMHETTCSIETIWKEHNQREIQEGEGRIWNCKESICLMWFPSRWMKLAGSGCCTIFRPCT